MSTKQITYDMISASVADIIVAYPNGISIFNKYNIDYCCGGKKSLEAACEQVGIDPEKVLDELRNTQDLRSPSSLRFDTWDVSLLIDFIVQHHHGYVKRSIPQLLELVDKVCSVHGENHAELITIRENFEKISEELVEHMKKEELILFPGIRKLFSDDSSTENSALPFDLNIPIQVMEDEHEHVGALIKSIRSLSQYYTAPATACPTFRLTYARLKEFDLDLMQHIHLENNILFKKVRNK